MNIKLTPEALEGLKTIGYDKYKYVLIQMVNHSCNGAVLKLAARRDLNEDDYVIKEESGYNFAISKSEAEMFSDFEIDYVAEGLSQGISVKALDSKMGQCFPDFSSFED